MRPDYFTMITLHNAPGAHGVYEVELWCQRYGPPEPGRERTDLKPELMDSCRCYSRQAAEAIGVSLLKSAAVAEDLFAAEQAEREMADLWCAFPG